MTSRKIVRVTEVRPKELRRLALRFDDGTEGVADVEGLLAGPVFEEIRLSDDVFAEVDLDGLAASPGPTEPIWTPGFSTS